MKVAQVSAYALGIALPIASGNSEDGGTTGSVEGVSVATYAILGQRFTVAGSAAGDDGQCSGQITVILDDINPLLTILGGGGILVAIISIIILIFFARAGSGCLWRIFGAVFGAIGGTGAALAGEQFGLLDPTQIFGLIVAIAGALIGFLVPGIFGTSGAPTPGAPSPAPQPAPAPPMTPREYGDTATDIFTGGETPGGHTASGEPASGEPYPGRGVRRRGPM